VPESATAYDLQPENLPEGMGWDEGLAENWQNAFHEAGISQEQAQKLSQAYTDITNNQLTQANQTLQLQSESEMEMQRAELQKQWGDKYDTNLQNAVNMASTMGFDLESQQDMAAIRNPKVLNMILAKYDSLKEGSLPRGGQPNTGTDSFHNQAMAMKAKYPNMNTAPIEVQHEYIHLQKMHHLQMSQRGQ
jgi:transposase